MRYWWVGWGVLFACDSGTGSSASSPTSTSLPRIEAPQITAASVLAKVGDKPHIFVDLDLHQPAIVAMLGSAGAQLVGGMRTQCGLDITKIDRVRIAIGEPLRVAAEIDGAIDGRRLACASGIPAASVHDRAGGVSLEVDASPAPASAGAELLSKCPERCAIARVGHAGKPVWVAAEATDRFTFRLSGPGLGGGAAAFAAAVHAVPELAHSDIHDDHGTLVARFPDTDVVTFALAMRADVIEAFHVPSTSMVPTIHVGDRILSGKGPLLGTPAPGDVLVYTPSPDRDWIQRVMGLPGQTLDDTDDGVVVDGKKLPSEVVDAKFSYDDVKPDGSTERRRGMVVREHLGARSYLLLRGAAPRVRGPWKVPANTLFFMGDNRLNANDSRYNPPAPRSSVTGRVLTVWWAMNGNVPDWERIGTPIE